MSTAVIQAEGLSKRYQLGVVGATTLREDCARIWRGLRGSPATAERGEFWALRDVSFAIAPGEVVGIVGRNGAGKSTLLKILSRITEPTKGRAVLRGRVASLLEVGTGFHPDLTGRENVFLNGSILGMKEGEIETRFDRIVAFAEVEQFIDTPVKHYSSGMRVRLAFAVAAHLEAEILIVDEVLAVGDAEFQQRCLQQLDDLAHRRARTVILVSHQLEMIRRLADRCLVMDRGNIVFDGGAADGIARHTANSLARVGHAIAPAAPDATGSILAVHLRNAAHGEISAPLPVGAPWLVEVELEVRKPIPNGIVALGLKTADGIWVRTGWSPPRDLSPGKMRITFASGNWRLAPGRYYAAIGFSSSSRSIHYIEEAALLTIGRTAVDNVAVRLEGVGLILDPWDTKWS